VRSANIALDLTTKARIREAALDLFAANGVDGTSVRRIAEAAGVSPALVIHHYGSKAGLRRAVDENVIERILLALEEVPIERAGAELIEERARLVAALFRRRPALGDYVGRTLAEGGDAAASLFHRMFHFASRDRRLAEAGAIRAEADPFWRAMHQLLLVVGPLVLRPLVERELGGSLLAGDGFERWMKANADLLRNGLYT
jgi:AcrR family transcriptional regulator